jgi:hypothetical protein
LTCRPNFAGLSLGIDVEKLIDRAPHALMNWTRCFRIVEGLQEGSRAAKYVATVRGIR